MSQAIQKTLRDSAAMRWTALLLLALAMFCSYIFMDILSPIKDLMQETRGWDSTAFGTMQGSEVFLNVFAFFLIFAGIILDKMGVRFTAVLSAAVMLVGAVIKWYAVSDSFIGSGLETWFTNNLNYIPIFDELGVSPFYEGMPASAKFAACGFMIFGCGCEMAGITVSRGIVKWFKGREMALAMGSEMALARLGVATCMIFSPFFARLGGQISVSRSVAFGVVLMCIALIMTIVYFVMDQKLDAQTGEAEEKDDPFKVSDLGKILTDSGFWIVALLCVLYYSAIFPFQKYAVNMLQCNLSLTPPAADSFWAQPDVTIVQYVIMLIVAAAGFASNFQKKANLKYGLLAISILALITYCYMGYMRQSAESIFAVDARPGFAAAHCLPPDVCLRTAHVQGFCHRRHHHRLRHHPRAGFVVLTGARLTVALGAQARRCQGHRFGLRPDFLDSEHRPMALPAAHRQGARCYQPGRHRPNQV